MNIQLRCHVSADACSDEKSLRELIKAGQIPEEFHGRLAEWWSAVKHHWPRHKQLERELETIRDQVNKFGKMAQSLETMLKTIESGIYPSKIYEQIRFDILRTKSSETGQGISSGDLDVAAGNKLKSILGELDDASIIFKNTATSLSNTRKAWKTNAKVAHRNVCLQIDLLWGLMGRPAKVSSMIDFALAVLRELGEPFQGELPSLEKQMARWLRSGADN